MTNAVSLAQGASNNTTFRNRIINGGMVIDQRNAGASVTPTSGQYLVDRFLTYVSQASKLTAQQNAGSVTPPVGFAKYLGFTSSSAYSITTSDYFMLLQKVEGFNISDLAWGTANAAPVTLSFWVRSSLTGTFGGSIRNPAASASYPFSYTVSSANTWTAINITISGPTIGSWSTDSTTGLEVDFGLGVGSTYSGTAGAWAAADYRSATGATSVVGTSGATFYITGVQLEKGTVATPFEQRLYGTELALCQRYYWIVSGSNTPAGSGVSASGTLTNVYVKHPVSMRSAPTFTQSSTVVNIGSASYTCTGINNAYATFDTSLVQPTVSSGLSATQGVTWLTNNGYVSASSEL